MRPPGHLRSSSRGNRGRSGSWCLTCRASRISGARGAALCRVRPAHLMRLLAADWAQTTLEKARSATLLAGCLHSVQAKSNRHLPRAQFVPNTPRNRGHSRLFGVSLFPFHVKKPPSRRLTGFVFQAGHASSILVTRSAAKRRAVNTVATRYLKFQAGHVVPFSYRAGMTNFLVIHFLDGPGPLLLETQTHVWGHYGFR
jgi:hypothetical protein